MILEPARCGPLYSPSGTSTVQDYRLAAYRRQLPARDEEPSAQLARLFTLGSRARLAALRRYEDNWDGSGSARPSLEAIANAEARLPELYRLSTVQGVWREPHVSASDTGEVSFEWWSGDRKITMYFGTESVEMLRVWGTNIDSEMDLQPMPSLGSFPAAWSWLYGN